MPGKNSTKQPSRGRPLKSAQTARNFDWTKQQKRKKQLSDYAQYQETKSQMDLPYRENDTTTPYTQDYYNTGNETSGARRNTGQEYKPTGQYQFELQTEADLRGYARIKEWKAKLVRHPSDNMSDFSNIDDYTEPLAGQRFKDRPHSTGSMTLIKSSFIDHIDYNMNTMQLIVLINNKSYTYPNVTYYMATQFMAGRAICITSDPTGQGRWYPGKTPSLGAYFNRFIKRTAGGGRFTAFARRMAGRGGVRGALGHSMMNLYSKRQIHKRGLKHGK